MKYSSRRFALISSCILLLLSACSQEEVIEDGFKFSAYLQDEVPGTNRVYTCSRGGVEYSLSNEILEGRWWACGMQWPEFGMLISDSIYTGAVLSIDSTSNFMEYAVGTQNGDQFFRSTTGTLEILDFVAPRRDSLGNSINGEIEIEFEAELTSATGTKWARITSGKCDYSVIAAF